MKNVICSCGWKHNGIKCPACNELAPVDKKVKMFNSTLKADPSKKPKQTKQINRFKKDFVSRAGTMKEYVQFRYPGYKSGPVLCDNCGCRIDNLRYENISHVLSRGSRPDLAHDFNNLEIICGPNQFIGSIDKSCHTLRHTNIIEFYKKRKNKDTNKEKD